MDQIFNYGWCEKVEIFKKDASDVDEITYTQTQSGYLGRTELDLSASSKKGYKVKISILNNYLQLAEVEVWNRYLEVED